VATGAGVSLDLAGRDVTGGIGVEGDYAQQENEQKMSFLHVFSYRE
jgi:hypothetical protein